MTATFMHIITLNISILIISCSCCRFIISWLICSSRTLYLLTVRWWWHKKKSFQYCSRAFECSAENFFNVFFSLSASIPRRVFITLTQWLQALFLVESEWTPAVHNCGFAVSYRLNWNSSCVDFAISELSIPIRVDRHSSTLHSSPRWSAHTSMYTNCQFISFHFTPSFHSQSMEMH